jgi:glycosyltransferase involved in cell wall biosynthesis
MLKTNDILFFDSKVRKKDLKKFANKKIKNVKIKSFPWSDYKKYLPGVYCELMELAILKKAKLDVLHVTSPDIRVPLGYRGKVICTFHNLSVYQWPDLFSRGARLKAKYNRQFMAKKSDIAIAGLEAGRKDLKRYLKIKNEKIEVIENGVDQRFFETIKESDEKIDKYLATKFKIKKEYILFTGTIDPVKNITRLIEAFWDFKNQSIQNNNFLKYQLVISGKKGWLSDKYQQLIKDLELERDVIFSGYVDGEDLKKLFSRAHFFVMPSLYESSGMTVLEAMACKTPCLVSDLDSLREATGNIAEFTNPFDVYGLSLKMKSLAENEKRKAELIKKGYKIAKKYSWDKCAKNTLKIYKKLNKK